MPQLERMKRERISMIIEIEVMLDCWGFLLTLVV